MRENKDDIQVLVCATRRIELPLSMVGTSKFMEQELTCRHVDLEMFFQLHRKVEWRVEYEPEFYGRVPGRRYQFGCYLPRNDT